MNPLVNNEFQVSPDIAKKIGLFPSQALPNSYLSKKHLGLGITFYRHCFKGGRRLT